VLKDLGSKAIALEQFVDHAERFGYRRIEKSTGEVEFNRFGRADHFGQEIRGSKVAREANAAKACAEPRSLRGITQIIEDFFLRCGRTASLIARSGAPPEIWRNFCLLTAFHGLLYSPFRWSDLADARIQIDQVYSVRTRLEPRFTLRTHGLAAILEPQGGTDAFGKLTGEHVGRAMRMETPTNKMSGLQKCDWAHRRHYL
jgi:hypothetical protein